MSLDTCYYHYNPVLCTSVCPSVCHTSD